MASLWWPSFFACLCLSMSSVHAQASPNSTLIVAQVARKRENLTPTPPTTTPPPPTSPHALAPPQASPVSAPVGIAPIPIKETPAPAPAKKAPALVPMSESTPVPSPAPAPGKHKKDKKKKQKKHQAPALAPTILSPPALPTAPESTEIMQSPALSLEWNRGIAADQLNESSRIRLKIGVTAIFLLAKLFI